MNKSFSSALAWGGVLLAGALWGGGALVAHQLIAGGLPPTSLALARFALGLPLLWWWHRRHLAANARAEAPALQWRELTTAQRALVLGTGCAMAFNVCFWFFGIEILGATLPTVISVCCAPVLVAVVSLLRGYERASPRLAFALALALAGVVLLVLPAAGWVLPQGYAKGLAWSFACAVTYAVVVLGNARMPQRVAAVSASAWGMTAAALTMLLLAGAEGLGRPAGTAGWLGLLYTGVVSTSVAYLLFAWGARRLTPTATVVGSLIEPLCAALLAAWLLGEALAPRQWLGGGLLGLAMWLLARRR